MKTRKYICVQSSYYPADRLSFNEQAQYIAQQTKSTLYDRIKCSIIESLTEL